MLSNHHSRQMHLLGLCLCYSIEDLNGEDGAVVEEHRWIFDVNCCRPNVGIGDFLKEIFIFIKKVSIFLIGKSSQQILENVKLISICTEYFRIRFSLKTCPWQYWKRASFHNFN